MSQGFQYHIDIVLCIDVTADMGPVLDVVKEKVRNVAHDLKDKFAAKGKIVNTLRIRTIAFRDLANDADAMQASEFFVVEPNNDLPKLESFINGLSASGGGDEPESALEALAIAIMSDWTHAGDRQRHIIVMFTNASAHKLESRVGEVPAPFKDQVPASLDELTLRWEGNPPSYRLKINQLVLNQSIRLKKHSRRLLVFGPDAYPWNIIGDSWGQTVWLPSQAGKGLEDVEYSTIFDTIANGI